MTFSADTPVKWDMRAGNSSPEQLTPSFRSVRINLRWNGHGLATATAFLVELDSLQGDTVTTS